MAGALEPGSVPTKQQRIAELAKQSPQMGFTSLNHYLDAGWLLVAFLQTRKDGAPGVDGQTGDDYAEDLWEKKLPSLLERASGTYWAPPVRRVRIPKGTGTETRPLGIPTLEDKVLQRAVVMALEPIYEQDFLDCSYGFRPGRSAHRALQALCGAKQLLPVNDEHGWRMGRIVDPGGHHWEVGRPLASVEQCG